MCRFYCYVFRCVSEDKAYALALAVAKAFYLAYQVSPGPVHDTAGDRSLCVIRYCKSSRASSLPHLTESASLSLSYLATHSAHLHGLALLFNALLSR